ncbi:MAG: hypothetical protein ACTHZI_07525 [Luteimonas sp.]
MDTFEGDCGSSAEHEAVNRLYELAREGDTDSGEYLQLDSLVYDSLLRAYGVRSEAAPGSAPGVQPA